MKSFFTILLLLAVAHHAASQSIIMPPTRYCSGTPISFSYVGGPPCQGQYQWTYDGSLFPTGATISGASASLIYGAAGNAIVRCNCSAGGAGAATQPFTVEIGNNPVVINVTASTNNICPGTAVTFTANSATGGPNAEYIWFENNVSIPNNNSKYFTTSSLTNNEPVRVMMTPDYWKCPASMMPMSSNTVSTTVKTANTISATLNQLVNGTTSTAPFATICSSSAPTMSFRVDVGWSAGAPSTSTIEWFNGPSGNTAVTDNGASMVGSVYSPIHPELLLNGHIIKARISGPASECITNSPFNVSSPLSIITTPPPLIVTISANKPLVYCQGLPITFTASLSANNTNPVYQWKVDGVNVGTNSSQFTASSLAPGVRQVSCTATPGYPCYTAATSSVNVSIAGPPSVPAVKTILGAGSISLSVPPYGTLQQWAVQWTSNPTTVAGETFEWRTSYGFTEEGQTNLYVSYLDKNSWCETARSPVSVIVYKNADPGIISGTTSPVRNSVHRYAASRTVTGYNYQWTVPAGYTLLSGQGTPVVTVQAGTTGGIIQVEASNAWKVGLTVTLYLSVADVSYVRDETLLTPVTNASGINTLPVESRLSKTTFIDGLGRPIQEVVWQNSPSKRDMARPVDYDVYGRQAVNYLPYASASNSGDFKPNWDSEQPQFYNGTAKVATDNLPSALSVFEPSPLERVWEQGAAGTAWQPTDKTGRSAGHTVKMDYLANDINEVRQWAYDYATGLCSSADFYGKADLYKTKVTDENGYQSQEYKDKLGQAVYKKSQDATGFIETYYVYDDFGKLRITIPPMGVKTLQDAGNWNVSQTFLDTWCFQYQYDQEQRQSQVKIPGAGWQYMVYDNRDRLVMTQDARQRGTNQWLFKKHDLYNRPVSMGTLTYGSILNQAQMQAVVDGVYTGATPRSYSVSRIAATDGYTDESFPKSTDGTLNYLNQSYYDDYSFKATWNGGGTAYDFVPELGSTTYFNRLVNKVTGVKVKVLNDNTWLKTVSYYDERGRVIQTIADNYAGGMDRNTIQYDFAGRILSTLLTHTGIEPISVLTENSYDHASRLTDIHHTINGGDRVNIAHYEYNELGQLVDKKLHFNTGLAACSGTTLTVTSAACATVMATQSVTFGMGFSFVASAGNTFTATVGTSGGGGSPTSGYLQSVDYRYNTRGWLTSINNSALTADGITNDDGNDVWGMELRYNNPALGTTAQYNGNIAEMKWGKVLPSALITTTSAGYAFSYDPANRLINAQYFSKLNGSWNNNGNYDETPAYDKNGNITSLSRYALISGTKQLIDQMAYTYNGNQVTRIDDAAAYNGAVGFINGASTAAEYTYDANGSMATDLNKGINVAYNFLNLSQAITNTTGTALATYTYDAMGNKLKKVTPGGTTYYMGNLQFDANKLLFVGTQEGRVFNTNGTLSYQYFMKDHLGNVRMSFDNGGPGGTAVPIQIDDFFPYGLQLPGQSYVYGTDKNAYLYNGKEKQEETGLYDYGARFYDPVTGRWGKIDNKAEIYLSFSPYTYAANNPIRFIDPDGNTIEVAGTDAQVKRINSALNIVAKTNPQLYNALSQAKEVFIIQIRQMNAIEKDNNTGASSSLNFEGSERTEEHGDFSTELTAYDGLKDEDPSMKGSKFTKGTIDGQRIEITEAQANESVEMTDNVISIDDNLFGKEFAKTVAHEFGHAKFTLLNKAKAFFLPKTKAKGHEPDNPNGEAAKEAETEFEQNYKNAKKELKEEDKHE